ncbi:uncharacterized protein LOC119765086 [Culex quinquefasciatus]|uniref:uncharacterized protein LOC119765086 n=1 Tax=Culex quinquefasciatus TaxID=7176 RepID=UPI0018E3EE7A|nr:uncharacterized protein LOC119765086 [Culex quinquefasciatus]
MSTRAKLVKKRDLIIAHLTQTKSFLKGYDVATQRHLVSVRMEKLEGKWEEFEALQLEIEELEDKDYKAGVTADASKEEVEKRVKQLEEKEQQREDMMRRLEELYYELLSWIKLPDNTGTRDVRSLTAPLQPGLKHVSW